MMTDLETFDNQIKPSEKNSVPKIKKVRCAVCRKKLGLLGFDCKCSSTLKFCAEHRLPENHDCQFDHKSQQICNLADKLIKVSCEKVIKI